jgi:hypothetical protein
LCRFCITRFHSSIPLCLRSSTAGSVILASIHVSPSLCRHKRAHQSTGWTAGLPTQPVRPSASTWAGPTAAGWEERCRWRRHRCVMSVNARRPTRGCAPIRSRDRADGRIADSDAPGSVPVGVLSTEAGRCTLPLCGWRRLRFACRRPSTRWARRRKGGDTRGGGGPAFRSTRAGTPPKRRAGSG